MKISKIFGKNFGKASEISVNVDPALTYFVGPNSAGKTTIGLGIVWFVMMGLAQKGEGLIAERYRFIGPAGPSARGGIEIIDKKRDITHTVTRKLLKNKTELEIKSSDGVVRGQEFLSSIFSTIFFDLRKLSRMTGKEQALALGIDTSGFEAQRRILFQGRHDIGVDVKRLKGVAESSRGAEKVEEVSLAELLKEAEQRRKQNEENKKQRVRFESTKNTIEAWQADVQEMYDDLAKLQQKIVDKEKDVAFLEEKREAQEAVIDSQEAADEDEVKLKISQAEETNTKARAYQQSLTDQQAHETEQAKYDAKTTKIQDLDTELAQYLHNQKLPFSNITIEDGEFRLSGRPFCEPYFSTGELLRFTAKLADKIMAKMDQKLEYLWIPGCQDIDEENRHKLFDELVKANWQIAAEFVDTKKQKKGHSILLREMKVVQSYDEKEKGGKLI